MPTCSKDHYSNSALHVAVWDDQVETVKSILSRLRTESNSEAREKALNSKNDYLETPLHIAVRRGHFEITYLLVEAGSSCQQRGLLHYAVGVPKKDWDEDIRKMYEGKKPSEERQEILKFLIKQESDVNQKNLSDEYPLFVAVKNNQYDLAKILLDNNAGPNDQNKYGQTALHQAVLDKNPLMISTLLAYNADLGIVDHSNCTPISLASPDIMQHIQYIQNNAFREYENVFKSPTI